MIWYHKQPRDGGWLLKRAESNPQGQSGITGNEAGSPRRARGKGRTQGHMMCTTPINIFCEEESLRWSWERIYVNNPVQHTAVKLPGNWDVIIMRIYCRSMFSYWYYMPGTSSSYLVLRTWYYVPGIDYGILREVDYSSHSSSAETAPAVYGFAEISSAAKWIPWIAAWCECWCCVTCRKWLTNELLLDIYVAYRFSTSDSHSHSCLSSCRLYFARCLAPEISELWQLNSNSLVCRFYFYFFYIFQVLCS